MRNLMTICALVLVVALAGVAYADVQSVKVSGDITIRGFFRDNYDLKDETKATSTPGQGSADDSAFYMQTTRVQIDADLTDNVSTTVRLLNERDWDADQGANGADDIQLDLSSITFKELFYSPLTVTVGRQEIHLGNDFIIGDFDGSAAGGTGLTATEFSAIKSTDAISAVLDLDPWTITGFIAKVDENTATINDDVDLLGINAGYKLGSYNGEVEVYYIALLDDAAFRYGTTAGKVRSYEEREVYTLGVRGSMDPIDELTVSLEVAKQFGEMRDDVINTGIAGEPNTTQKRDVDGWALQLGADYDVTTLAYPVNVGVEYTYLSGEEKGNDGDFGAWIPMAENQVLGEILEGLIATNGTWLDANDTGSSLGITNINAFALKATVQPTDSVTVGIDVYKYWLDEKPTAVTGSTTAVGRKADDDFGTELDVNVLYDYTEDVSFGLLAAMFLPGDTFTSYNDDEAVQVVGSVNVAF